MQPAAAQPAAPEIITELPRWAQELTQAIESLDLGSFLSETDAARQKGRGKETR